MIYYSDSTQKGGEICLNKIKRPQKIYDIFPNKKFKNLQKYKISNNSLLIILNVPWAYHSVS